MEYAILEAAYPIFLPTCQSCSVRADTAPGRLSAPSFLIQQMVLLRVSNADLIPTMRAFIAGRRGESRIGSMQRRGEDTTVRALRWLEKDPHNPAFLWIHIWDAHDPYDPPAPFNERYSKAPYDGCIAYVDATLGKLFAELRAAGIYDNALIAVMSDHGESLGEHGENTHGVFLYDSTIRVPLLVKFPNAKFAKQKVSARANLADVAPTVLDAIQVPIAGGNAGAVFDPTHRREGCARPHFLC